jgi:hypothetical protein
VNEQLQILRHAFPTRIEAEVVGALAVINFNAPLKPAGSFQVSVDGEMLEIPYRIYYDEPTPDNLRALSVVQSEILACLYTRHHNGFVREKYAGQIVASNQSWIPSFVLRLLGEYVIEILYAIERNLNNLNQDTYRQFLTSNREFYETTKRRVMSYWDSYYRRQYPDRNSYVGLKIVRFFDELL